MRKRRTDISRAVNRWQRRVALGRWIALLGGAGYAATRTVVYTFDLSGRPPEGIEMISGTVPVQVWGGMWGLAAVLCVIDAVRGHTRYGLPAIVGIGFVWATGYASAWAMSGFSSDSWFGAAAYASASAIILGLLIKVGGLKNTVGR